MLFPTVCENVARLAVSGDLLLVGRGLDRDLGFGVLDSDSFVGFCVVFGFPLFVRRSKQRRRRTESNFGMKWYVIRDFRFSNFFFCSFFCILWFLIRVLVNLSSSVPSSSSFFCVQSFFYTFSLFFQERCFYLSLYLRIGRFRVFFFFFVIALWLFDS